LNVQVAELRTAFDNVWARFDSPKKTIHLIGMALPLGVGKEAPTRLMVFPLGEPPSNDDRKWRFTAENLAKVVTDFETRTEPLPILYEHGKGPRGGLAAGWIDSVDLASDGLYANVHWTDTARKEIRSGEWAFRSPAWDGEESADGFLTGGPLSHLALVNDPAIGGMPPVVASSQPSTELSIPSADVPAGQEPAMAVPTTITAAKTKAATSIDKAGVLDAIKAAYPGCEVFGDDVLSDLISDVLEGGVEDAPDAPGAKPPMAPGAEAKPPSTPAVPLFTSAEDVANLVEAATAAAKVEFQERIKALEARELTGKIVNASAADRVPAQQKTFAERIRESRAAGMRS
jgi:hypothetical protein